MKSARQIKHPRCLDKQSGLTLVEVLVTVLITSVGILGLAGLQGVSVKLSYDSYLRTQATFLARDLADRMLTNPDGDYTVSEIGFSSLSAPEKSCASSVQDNRCDVAQMAAHDLYHWADFAKNVMPDAKFTVAAPGTGNTLHIITIKWKNNQAKDGSDQQLIYTAL